MIIVFVVCPGKRFPGHFYFVTFSNHEPMICRASSEKTSYSSGISSRVQVTQRWNMWFSPGSSTIR